MHAYVRTSDSQECRFMNRSEWDSKLATSFFVVTNIPTLVPLLRHQCTRVQYSTPSTSALRRPARIELRGGGILYRHSDRPIARLVARAYPVAQSTQFTRVELTANQPRRNANVGVCACPIVRVQVRIATTSELKGNRMSRMNGTSDCSGGPSKQSASHGRGARRFIMGRSHVGGGGVT